MSETTTYRVPGIHCGHCVSAVQQEVASVSGVEDVQADFESKLVTVRGTAVDEEAVRAAIAEAGYDAEP